jgi:archaellin
MASDTVVIAVVGSDFALSNIYSGAEDSSTKSLQALMFDVNASDGSVAHAKCYIFNDDGNTDTVLKQNEKAYIILYLGGNTLANYSKVKVEVRTSRGAALMVQRDIPGGLPTDDIVDLG